MRGRREPDIFQKGIYMGKRQFDYPGVLDQLEESVEVFMTSYEGGFESIGLEEVENTQRRLFIASRDLLERAIKLYPVIRIKDSELRLKEAQQKAKEGKVG